MDQYTGDLKNNQMDGWGAYNYHDSGDLYEGGWKNGQIDGFGRSQEANGNILMGQCKEGYF